MAVKPRRSQYEKGISELRSMILNGDFAPQERLSETMLAELLEISRTPLRQAIDRLLEEGLLERRPSGGTMVARITMQDIVDAIELRGVLEGTAARFAAERGISTAKIAEGNEILGELDEAVFSGSSPDFSCYVPLNLDFHIFLSKISGSSIMEREVDRAYRLPVASPTAFLGGQELIPDFQASLRRAQRQHRAIFDAIVLREGTRAQALTIEHARLARENLEYITKENPKLAEHVPGLALIEAA